MPLATPCRTQQTASSWKSRQTAAWILAGRCVDAGGLHAPHSRKTFFCISAASRSPQGFLEYKMRFFNPERPLLHCRKTQNVRGPSHAHNYSYCTSEASGLRATGMHPRLMAAASSPLSRLLSSSQPSPWVLKEFVVCSVLDFHVHLSLPGTQQQQCLWVLYIQEE